jgi:hypothetical protein
MERSGEDHLGIRLGPIVGAVLMVRVRLSLFLTLKKMETEVKKSRDFSDGRRTDESRRAIGFATVVILNPPHRVLLDLPPLQSGVIELLLNCHRLLPNSPLKHPRQLPGRSSLP